MSQILQFKDQFHNTRKDASSLTNFCHILKNLSNTPSDVESPIIKVELVMKILCQLPLSYHSIFDIIKNTKPFPKKNGSEEHAPFI